MQFDLNSVITLFSGPAGPAGPAGPTGPAGPAGGSSGAVFTATANGAVPASGTNSARRVLRGDGTWGQPFGYKNVRDFGARGDGETDDTAAIQAAVNQGGNIVFPSGTYNISSPIIISGDEGYVSLIGDGNVVLQWAGETAGWMIDRPSGGEGKSVICISRNSIGQPVPG
jgi:hypothetical protein